MELVFATHNHNKAKEIQALMPKEVRIKTLDEIHCFEDIPETATTLEGNAQLKAAYIVHEFGMNCFADDTGLEIEALNMEPGVYSARYAGENRDAQANMDLVLHKLKDETNRTARFRTVIVLYWHGKYYQFEGIVNGAIGYEKMGKDGFGYDPIFYPEGSDRTFAEMSLEEKNKISHRARAFEKMILFVNQQSTAGNQPFDR